MRVESCIPVIPSTDLEKSLHFWVDGLGLSMDRAMRQDGRLVGCMVHNERLYFWLNQRAGSPIKPQNYEGIRLYWAPDDIKALRERLLQQATRFLTLWIATMGRPSSSSRTMTATPTASV
jgi:hypothetical protein